MPLIGTRGAASAQGFGEFAQSGPVNYIEDVFSTYLYTGNGSDLAINNGIDLSTKGGLVWVKERTGTYNHYLMDTANGANKFLSSNTTTGLTTPGMPPLASFNTNGFTTGGSSPVGYANVVNASWTFREQPKFFDVVTYTGNGSNDRQISHNLQSTPGFIIVKRTDSAGYEWTCWQRTQTGYFLFLNTTDARFADTGSNKAFNTGTPMSSTTFSVGAYSNVNANGGTYVAYLFAHDAGGFGTAGTDNVISCGSYTGNGSTSGPTINLGYEPQYVLIKRADSTGDWYVMDTMRGLTGTASTYTLYPNLSNAESGPYDYITINATGFQATTTYGQINGSGGTFIYIAIRRGPMKTPTSVTGFFTPVTQSNANPVTYTAGFPVDLVIHRNAINSSVGEGFYESSRLIGPKRMKLWGTFAEESTTAKFDSMTTVTVSPGSTDAGTNSAHLFRRAPGFMDVVCYTGTGANRSLSHNLGVVPEFMIVKSRSGAYAWVVYHKDLGATKYLFLNYDAAVQTGNEAWNDTSPTSTQFTVSLSNYTGANATTYVAYLFASCPGVSKVGSYSGTGGTQTISCGFAARYVLIKRTDSTGDWWVWDTARGMVSGTDPRIGYNITTAQVNNNWVYTDASGFQIVTTDATVNASGGSYIYLAIA